MGSVLKKLKKALTPKLRCDSSSTATSPPRPSETASSEFSTTSSSFSREKCCAICLSNVKRGQGQAIFTAECSHSFHFDCIAKNVEHGNLCCPICRAKWDKINVPFQAPKDSVDPQRNNLGRIHPHPEPRSFSDDEPLLTTSSTQSSVSQSVTIKIHTESPAISASESRTNFPVLVSIRAPPLEDPNGHSRTPIDLVTVLDVSGSMGETKLSLVKSAVKFLIQNLGPSDRLSIVSFSTTATRVFPLRRMSDDGRESAILAVESLRSSGGTSIAEGLKKGTRVLEERRERNPVASIMFLSDGIDSYYPGGSQLKNQLPASIFSSKTEHGIPVHTFGFGKDHCPTTLHAISDASGGTFSFIESVETIQDSFAICIGGLLSVVTQELRLTLKSATCGVMIVAIPSGRYFSEISDKGKQGVVTVGNMYAEEEKQFLVYLFVPKSSRSATKTSLLEVLCMYKDLAANELIQVPGERIEILRPKVCSPAEKAVSLEVDRQCNRVSVAEAIAEAQRMAEMGNLKGAKATLAQERSTLLSSPAAQAGDSLITLLEAQLTEVIHRMATMDLYTLTGRAYALSEMSSHSLQRAAATGDSTTWSLTMSEGGNSATSSGVFETPHMSRMLRLSHNLGTNPAA
ncbi:E3 ubiquitin-protein ligase WAV3 [Rosa sericea]